MALLRDRADGEHVNTKRALRLAIALAALVVAALLAGSALATSRSEKNLQTLNHQVLAAVNKFRAAHGLVALHESAALDRSARQHSLEMGRVGYFAHSSADGTVFWRGIQHYYSKRGHSYWSVGENLLWESPSVGAAGAMKLWIGSPPHRKNLLAPEWRELGISAVRVVRAPASSRGAPSRSSPPTSASGASGSRRRGLAAAGGRARTPRGRAAARR
jgi:uncharacterized protein YkwD